jgi:hypothetical protein
MRLITSILLSLLLLGLSACDSNDELTDAQRFIGSWRASSITTPGLDLLDLLGTVTANFPTSRSFSMRAVDPSGETILDVSGTFEAMEGAITYTISGEQRPVTMNYAFENDDNTVVLTFSGSVLGDLGFSINPAVLALIGNQQITVTFSRQ